LCCTRHTRAYLHHLFRAEEILGPMLLTTHNLTYYQRLMRDGRAAILEGRYGAYCDQTRAGWLEAKHG
jgi:queuine tRNA-ribosyltransferase